MMKLLKSCTALGLLLALCCLSGCSQAENGALALAKNALTLEAVAVEETLTVDFSGEVPHAWEGTGFAGHLELDVTGTLAGEGQIYDLTINYRLRPDAPYQHLLRLMNDGESAYFSTEGLWQMVKATSAEDFSPAYLAEMDAYIAKHPLIKMTEDDRVLNVHFASVQTPDARQSRALLDALHAQLAGFSTGLVTAKDGGYALHVDGEAWREVRAKWLAYLEANPTAGYQMAQAVWAYQQESFAAGRALPTEEQWRQTLAKRLEGQSTQQAKAPLAAQDYLDAFWKMTGPAGQRVLSGNLTLHLEDLGITLTSAATFTELAAVNAPAMEATSGNAFDAGLAAINARYTVTSGVRLEPEREGFASAFIMQTFCGHPRGNLNYAALYDVDGAYYIAVSDLPRLLPDAQVSLEGDWAAMTFKGRTARIQTKQITDSFGQEASFVHVRGLSQLGITVDYQAPPEVITLTFPS